MAKKGYFMRIVACIVLITFICTDNSFALSPRIDFQPQEIGTRMQAMSTTTGLTEDSHTVLEQGARLLLAERSVSPAITPDVPVRANHVPAVRVVKQPSTKSWKRWLQHTCIQIIFYAVILFAPSGALSAENTITSKTIPLTVHVTSAPATDVYEYADKESAMKAIRREGLDTRRIDELINGWAVFYFWVNDELASERRIREELVKMGSLAVPSLVIALESPDHDIGTNAAITLGKIRDPKAVPALIRAFEKEYNFELGSYYLQEAAKDALIAIEDKRAIPVFRKSLDDPRGYIRAWGKEGLTKLGAMTLELEIAESLYTLAYEGWSDDRTAAKQRLIQYGYEALPALKDAYTFARTPKDAKKRIARVMIRIVRDELVSENFERIKNALNTLSDVLPGRVRSYVMQNTIFFTVIGFYILAWLGTLSLPDRMFWRSVYKRTLFLGFIGEAVATGLVISGLVLLYHGLGGGLSWFCTIVVLCFMGRLIYAPMHYFVQTKRFFWMRISEWDFNNMLVDDTNILARRVYMFPHKFITEDNFGKLVKCDKSGYNNDIQNQYWRIWQAFQLFAPRKVFTAKTLGILIQTQGNYERYGASRKMKSFCDLVKEGVIDGPAVFTEQNFQLAIQYRDWYSTVKIFEQLIDAGYIENGAIYTEESLAAAHETNPAVIGIFLEKAKNNAIVAQDVFTAANYGKAIEKRYKDLKTENKSNTAILDAYEKLWQLKKLSYKDIFTGRMLASVMQAKDAVVLANFMRAVKNNDIDVHDVFTVSNFKLALRLQFSPGINAYAQLVKDGTLSAQDIFTEKALSVVIDNVDTMHVPIFYEQAQGGQGAAKDVFTPTAFQQMITKKFDAGIAVYKNLVETGAIQVRDVFTKDAYMMAVYYDCKSAIGIFQEFITKYALFKEKEVLYMDAIAQVTGQHITCMADFTRILNTLQSVNDNAPVCQDVKHFANRFNEELSYQPEKTRDEYIRHFNQDMRAYFNTVMPQALFAERAAQLSEVGSWLCLVHDNFSLCIKACNTMKKPLTQFRALREALPFNNALTRIVRTLGEGKNIVGGKYEVVHKVQQAGQFDILYALIVSMAEMRGTAAPQEVSGILDILDGYSVERLQAWSMDDWERLRDDIGAYYHEGFKFITAKLFDYFRQHRNDAHAIRDMKRALDKSLSGAVAWGHFWGFSEAFKKRYNLSQAEELALLGKYLPINNMSIDDYLPIYNQLKQALSNHSGWQDAVPDSARAIYSFAGDRVYLMYAGDKTEKERQALYTRLSGYCQYDQAGTLAYSVDLSLCSGDVPDEQIQAGVMRFLVDNFNLKKKELAAVPATDTESAEWLNIWSAAIGDTLKVDAKDKVRDIIRSRVEAIDGEAFDHVLLQYPEVRNIREYNQRAIEKAKKKQYEVKEITDNDMRRIIADRIYGRIMNLFDRDLQEIKAELADYRAQQGTSQTDYYVGFFDDLLHLMSFVMTGVCTRGERARQVNDTRYHFGKIAVKNAAGRILGVSQVQFAKVAISGETEKHDAKGWKVLALPGINIDKGDIPMERKKAVVAILQCAQKIADTTGLQGVVIPESIEIHSNNETEKKILSELIKDGWLRKKSLTEPVILSEGDYKYSYQSVYMLTIPKTAYFLRDANTGADTEEEDALQEAYIRTCGDGIGMICGERGDVSVDVDKVKQEMEYFLAHVAPQGIVRDVRKRIMRKSRAVTIAVERTTRKSYVNKSDDGRVIRLVLGEDVVYGDHAIEYVGLYEMFGELVAAVMLDDYNKLVAEMQVNENAYYKLRIVRDLCNMPNYLLSYYKLMHPAWNISTYPCEKPFVEMVQILTRYNDDLNSFAKKIKRIEQWNIFLDVMGNGDPGLLVCNYIHLLQKQQVSDEVLTGIVQTIAKRDIFEEMSLAKIREMVLCFFLGGKAMLHYTVDAAGNAIDTHVPVANFSFFDKVARERLDAYKATLVSTKSMDEFYATLTELLRFILPFDEETIAQEMNAFFDPDNATDLFAADDRYTALRDYLKEVCVRRLGGTVLASVCEHLTGNRGFKDIPYFHFMKEMIEGDADAYAQLSFMWKETDSSYMMRLLGDSGYNEQGHDWTADLFVLPDSIVPVQGSTHSEGVPMGRFAAEWFILFSA